MGGREAAVQIDPGALLETGHPGRILNGPAFERGNDEALGRGGQVGVLDQLDQAGLLLWGQINRAIAGREPARISLGHRGHFWRGEAGIDVQPHALLHAFEPLGILDRATIDRGGDPLARPVGQAIGPGDQAPHAVLLGCIQLDRTGVRDTAGRRRGVGNLLGDFRTVWIDLGALAQLDEPTGHESIAGSNGVTGDQGEVAHPAQDVDLKHSNAVAVIDGEHLTCRADGLGRHDKGALHRWFREAVGHERAHRRDVARIDVLEPGKDIDPALVLGDGDGGAVDLGLVGQDLAAHVPRQGQRQPAQGVAVATCADQTAQLLIGELETQFELRQVYQPREDIVAADLPAQREGDVLRKAVERSCQGGVFEVPPGAL